MELVTSSSKVVLVGEGMLQLSRCASAWSLGYGGDTLNTAIHLTRCGVDTAYLTALGSDPLSTQLRNGWEAEGLDTGLVLTDPDRHAGLYAITTDPSGERSFTYWRNESAARRMFSLPGTARAEQAAEHADLLLFSLITLAILPPTGRKRLLELCCKVRAHGGKVAFDSNYRPSLWKSRAEARDARDAAIAIADFGLPTRDDEAMLGHAPDGMDVSKHWQSLGCTEVIVKLGPDGCLLPDGRRCRPEQVLAPVDTSGAGDAFNAGYLFARLRGEEPKAAAANGHRFAAWTVMRAGSIPQIDADAPYPAHVRSTE